MNLFPNPSLSSGVDDLQSQPGASTDGVRWGTPRGRLAAGPIYKTTRWFSVSGARRSKISARSIFVRVWHWLTWKHVCAWCVPQRRLAGNPWARHVTHTICLGCMERQRRAIMGAASHPAHNGDCGGN